MSPSRKESEPFGDPARRLRDSIAPGTIGDPDDDMNDFPLIRDAGEPRTKARNLGRTNSGHVDEFDDERFDGGDFDPPPAEDPSEFGFEAGATQANDAGKQTTDWPPLTIEEWLARDLPAPDFIMGSWLSTTSAGF